MQYIWFIWSLILLAIWLVIYVTLGSKNKRREMITVSLWTSLLGLTEPLFVPAYWSPPSLFDLAIKTGFDIESLIFSFGIGGIAVVIYELLFKSKNIDISSHAKHLPLHRFHLWTILSAPVVFVVLLFVTHLNPLHVAIIAMMVGGFATWYCRPDLKTKMITSAFMFLILYFLYFLTLIAMSPRYVEKVWNLKAISGILVLGIPLEELLFAFSFGFIWSSIYEHLKWKRLKYNKVVTI